MVKVSKDKSLALRDPAAEKSNWQDGGRDSESVYDSSRNSSA